MKIKDNFIEFLQFKSKGYERSAELGN